MRKIKRRNFCDLSPTCYKISLQKEILKRNLKDMTCGETFSKELREERLSNLVAEHDSGLIKRGPGIDPVLQENKAVNIEIACRSINGMVVRPGETFSFWHTVGNTTKKKGYKDGRVIVANKLMPGIGGGLCNLANTLNLIVLESPLDITELHYHSDALAPDVGERVPLSTGTSVSYNNIDYRFKNNTDQEIQLCAWCENERLYAELRSEREFPFTYRIVEEDHHFAKEGENWYRISKIYREKLDRQTGKLLGRELLLDNHSQVMYDPALIPKELVR